MRKLLAIIGLTTLFCSAPEAQTIQPSGGGGGTSYAGLASNAPNQTLTLTTVSNPTTSGITVNLPSNSNSQFAFVSQLNGVSGATIDPQGIYTGIQWRGNAANVWILDNSALINFGSTGSLGFTASSAGGAADTNWSRCAAGVMCAGSGAQASVAGSVKATAFIGAGAAPTGTTGTCSASSFSGGTLAGQFTLTSICAIAGTVILSGLPTAPTGFSCWISDQVTGTAAIRQTASTTTTVTFTTTAATVANDTFEYGCISR
jgi:hypothetical protein